MKRLDFFPAALLAAAFLVGACNVETGTESTTEVDRNGTKPLRIAFIAYQNPDQLLESVEPVTEYLKAELGRPIEAFAATDYAGIVEALKAGSADAGFMGPLQYVIAHHQSGAVPILGELYNGAPTYVSHVFVRKDSGIESLEDLEQTSMAFVDPLSSSGYMFPLDTFLQAGLIESPRSAEDFFRKIYFAGGDEQAIRAVLNKFVDAAGVGQYSVKLLRPEEREQLVAIASSRPIPSHCVVVRAELDAETASELQQALLGLNQGDHQELLRNLYAVDGYVEADHETYRSVEALAREYGFLDSAG
ncbi:MAG: phosphate/phosphite/phosphonate ABC transporter substrate-binding protein [Thermoanaerobaculia bacterium]